MESKSYLMKTEEYLNNQTKECPYCNAIIPLSEFNDHIFCHQVDGQENGENNFNINNYGLQLNNNVITNNISNNSISNEQNNNNNPQDNNNNINQPYIDPESRRINSINIINENNNQNQNNNININSINNNNVPPNTNEGSIIDRIKNYFIPSNNSNNNKNERDIMSIPYDQLSSDERAQRNKIEEQRAYEKKILGIANSESPEPKIEDTRSTSEKITDFVQNNSDAILATIDIIGCLTLHTPSIGRTIMRVGNLIGRQYQNFNDYRNNNQNNNMEDNEYNNLIRNHPELRRKDKDVETIIKFLPVSEVKEIKINQESNNNNNKCVICLSEFEIGDQVSALPCAHVFHTECIASWLRKHCQCPVCKFNITLKSLIGGV